MPLSGLLVVDFTHTLAGPYCTQMLADAGATVVKVEPPVGEFSRRTGLTRALPDDTELAVYLASVNRGKQGIGLDLKHPDGLRVARGLAEGADVVVENFAPGTLERLGLDLTALRADHPGLVTCSISLFGGFRSAGELARRGGLAMVAESVSAVLGMQRDAEGAPVSLGLPLGDMATGLAAYGAITTAILARHRTGMGTHLDISMVKVMLSLNTVGIVEEQVEPAGAELDHSITGAAYGVFRATDGYFVVVVNSDTLFRRFAAAIGEPWLAEDARFAERLRRHEHADEVNAVLEMWASTRTVDEVIAAIGPAGVPCGRVATPRDILDDHDLAALGFLDEVPDGGGGHLRSPANPFGFDRPGAALPRLGEHTREVLRDRLGIDDRGYDLLRRSGAFGPAPDSDVGHSARTLRPSRQRSDI
jgi:crotonobetainyl-CoA:carnitine CoA-transferase CaiB-like acyl-CoA transferase